MAFYIDNPIQINVEIFVLLINDNGKKPQKMDQQTVSEVAAIVTDELL